MKFARILLWNLKQGSKYSEQDWLDFEMMQYMVKLFMN